VKHHHLRGRNVVFDGIELDKQIAFTSQTAHMFDWDSVEGVMINVARMI
jgi:hypothetical protein